MDFSKKGTLKKQQQIKSTSRKFATKINVNLFRVLLVSMVFLIIVGSFAGFGTLNGLADSAPSIDQITVEPTGFVTNILDKDNNIIQALSDAESNRVYVKIEEIPKIVSNSFISIEDERFYEHNGIDVQGIFRAFFSGLSQGDFDQGASTITQQLIKNQVFNGGAEDNFMDRLIRKIQEQYLSIQLEAKLDKDKILEYYLNTINLGAGTYGVQTASRRYFNKNVSELNLSEATVIAAIAQSPTRMNPINYPENNAKRRGMILDSMKRLGWCSEEEYNVALADDVYSRIESVNEETGVKSYYSYFEDALIEQVLKDLQEKKGYTYTQASKALFSGGLTIYTTQDSQVQNILDDVYSNEAYFPVIGKDAYWELTYALSVEKADGSTVHYHNDDVKNFDSSFTQYYTEQETALSIIERFKEATLKPSDRIIQEKTTFIIQPQSSMLIMDQKTGHVVALVGGRGEKQGNRTLNRATSSKRQPGSTFKIVSTYLPALDSAGMTLASVIDDAPYKYPGSDKFVNNWNGEAYAGLTTIRQAILNSMNVIAVKTFAKVTPQLGFEYLQKLGFTTLVDSRTESDGRIVSDKNLATALGGLTDGVTNLELTASFAAIANQGVYNEPIFYTKIVDHDGKVLLSNTSESNQVMKESTSFLLTSAMEDVVKSGTGTMLRFTNINMPVAGKTGTTSDDLDLWFSGYTPYYTASIWSGYDINRKQTNKSYQKRIWKEVMERIHIEKALPTVPFTIPESIVAVDVCTKSGKLAVEGLCDHYVGGSTVRTEYFAKGTQPTEKCDVHVKVTVCKESNQLAGKYCPTNSLVEKVFLSKEETSVTADTPHLLPTKECTIHKFGSNIFDNLTPTPSDAPSTDDSGEDDDFDLDDLFNYFR